MAGVMNRWISKPTAASTVPFRYGHTGLSTVAMYMYVVTCIIHVVHVHIHVGMCIHVVRVRVGMCIHVVHVRIGMCIYTCSTCMCRYVYT